jgi:protein-disulfide isomerase
MNLDRILSVTLTVAAVSLAAAVVYREIEPKGRPRAESDRPVLLTGWRELLAKGRSLGGTGAPVQVVEFADLECPACRHFHQTTLPLVREKFGDKVNFTFVHLPLSFHRFARAAAVASECAASQGRFVEFVEVVFGKQDSLGLKPWSSFASDAGVVDSASFAQCTLRPEAAKPVEAGRTLADSLNIRATPTVLINGWQFSTPPSAATMIRAIEAALAGRSLENSASPR